MYVEGRQVADLFAECAGEQDEFLSPLVTIARNKSLRLDVSSRIVYVSVLSLGCGHVWELLMA